MEQEDIKELYIRLSKDFSVLSFDEVLAECLKIAKKFYACYPLLFELGTLLINHTSQASSPEQVEQIMEKALEWFHRVRTEADETNLQKESLLMEAFCLLQLQRPSEVIDILEPVNMQPGSPEPLLASAYRAIGNDQEAKKILQVGIYKEIMTLFNLFPSYLNLCLNDAEQFAETCQRFYKIADVFQMKMLHPGILLGIYITIAQDWMKLNNAEQALDILSQYTELAVSNIYPLHLHGDDFFDLLDEWLDSELVLRSFPPRDETLIRHSMTQALIVSVDLFERANASIKRFSLSNKKPRDYLLRGKVFCGCCDHAMSLRNGAWFYCRHSEVAETLPCHGVRIKMADLEQVVFETIRAQMCPALGIDSNKDKLDLQTVQQTEHEEKLRSIQDSKRYLYEQYALGEIDLETYRTRKAVYDTELVQAKNVHAVITAQTKQIKSDYEIKLKQQEIVQKVGNANMLTKALIDRLINKVYVFPGDRIEIEYATQDFLETKESEKEV